MPKTNRSTVQVALYCLRCGNQQVIWRLESRQRDTQHVKHLHCHKCNRKVAHKPIMDDPEE